MSRVENISREVFISNPAEFIPRAICEVLKSEDIWKSVFTEIDSYQRMDYSMRSLPVLRVYNKTYNKQSDLAYVEGEVVMDCILPADQRRQELQDKADIISSALLQQFRRPVFFEKMMKLVPGLTEMGRRYDVDKSLAFEWQDGLVPLTQIRANFKIDLDLWDRHLEETGRTKDDPFEVTLGELKKIAWNIQGVDEQENVQVELKSDQPLNGG